MNKLKTLSMAAVVATVSVLVGTQANACGMHGYMTYEQYAMLLGNSKLAQTPRPVTEEEQARAKAVAQARFLSRFNVQPTEEEQARAKAVAKARFVSRFNVQPVKHENVAAQSTENN